MWTGERIFSEGDLMSMTLEEYKSILGSDYEGRLEHIYFMVQRLRAERRFILESKGDSIDEDTN